MVPSRTTDLRGDGIDTAGIDVLVRDCLCGDEK